LIYFTQ